MTQGARWLRSIALVALAALVPTPAEARGQDRQRPFLWRIEGERPSFVFGTIHVPLSELQDLPPAVRQAHRTSDAFFAEIPLDSGTFQTVLRRAMLPAGQDLRLLVGPELFERFSRAVTEGLTAALTGLRVVPPGAQEVLLTLFSRLKPWVAMSQLWALEYLPALLAGKPALDEALYREAQANGKEVGGLETLDEQLAHFDALSLKEQVQLLKSALDELDEAKRKGRSAGKDLVQSYLSGQDERLLGVLTKHLEAEGELKRKFLARILDRRNEILAERIARQCARAPSRSFFFAVGALHLLGERGIPALLTRKGMRVTRLDSR
jgi:uncharacterized protein YbaP (TraB family)